MKRLLPNKSVETNRRPALPLDGGQEFGRASYAPPFLSARPLTFIVGRNALVRDKLLDIGDRDASSRVCFVLPRTSVGSA